MNLSEIFLRRPVMTFLVMITIAFFGVLSYLATPVSDLPDVEFPTIQVSVVYPGADPQTIANNVVVPLEQQFITIQGIQTISSVSYTGSATIVLQFELNKPIDLAAPDVQAAINAASPHLPKDLPYAPVYEKFNPTATPILFFAITSATMSAGDLYDYAHTVIGERLNIIEGVAQVQTYGPPYAVRLQVDPQKLAAKGIGIDEVGQAIQQANVYIPTGTLYGPKNEFTISVNGQINRAEPYENLIIKNQEGSFVRFQDIGRALDSIQYDKQFLRFYQDDIEQPFVGLGIQKQIGANTAKVIEKIKEQLPKLKSELPGSLELFTMYDQSEYIDESLKDVKFTLLIALILVVFVIFIYFGKLLHTLIPALAIPLSVTGTFIVMLILGYTIDILSLLAITLSIGFLVDDAIVVLENIARHVEKKEPPMRAALNGTKEISITILSMTLCLSVVFIPLLFMEGIIGRILHEFAVTIVTAVLISGFISLSLTPLLCSRFLKGHQEGTKKKPMERFSEKVNEKLLNLYKPGLNWALSHRPLVLFIAFLSLGLSIFLFVKLPKDFFPGEDIGFIEAFSIAPDGTSPFEMAHYQDEISRIFKNNPNVDMVATIGSSIQDNQGVTYLRLKEIHTRLPMYEVIEELQKELASVVGVQVFLKPLPMIDLQVGATTSKGDYQYTLQSLDSEDLYTYATLMEKRMKELPGLDQVVSDLDISQPQLNVEILRDRASILNITAEQIETALNLAFADNNLSPINEPDNQYYVIMEVLPKFYKDPEKLSQIWLRSQTGKMVPLSAVTKITESVGPLTINHINGLQSTTISFNVKDVPLQTALNNLHVLAKEVLPPTVIGQVEGAASVFKSSFANLNFLLLITLFVFYVILGILYENLSSPITVMSTLPPAAIGGLLTLLLFGQTLSIYAFVGIILLLGIVLKNGIILVDFANETMKKEGKSPHDAIHEACLIRFRPILMTTFSALMGALPIAIGFGGMTAVGRRPLGLVIVGGLLFSQVLTLFLTPVIYTYIEALRQKFKKHSSPDTLPEEN